MTAEEASKQIDDAVDWLCKNGMSVHALDTIQEIYTALITSVSIGKPYKSSYSLKKNEEWERFEISLSEMAEMVKDWPPRWREVAIDSFVREINRYEK